MLRSYWVTVGVSTALGREQILGRAIAKIGSGTVVAFGLAAATVLMFALGHMLGWDATWRAFGVTPLQPPFYDMHIINDYAACAAKGVDAYAPQACNKANYNIPPAWLWLGRLGIDASTSNWLAAGIIVAAMIVMMLLFRGRSRFHGWIAMSAIISPSVMMGFERANLDLLILALVGSAALIYREQSAGRACGAIAILGVGVALKLFPMFCAALLARFSRRTFLFACAILVVSLIYLGAIAESVLLIRRNVPTTFILSYGYKAVFLGLDHMRAEAGIAPMRLADTWTPAVVAALVIMCAFVVALNAYLKRSEFCLVDVNAAGTAFLFGAGIYCGTYMLGTNFIYRLMFLLLCLPQLQDWLVQRGSGRKATAELGLFGIVLGVLWLNGNANGHSSFLLLPQLLNWLLFFWLSVVVMLNFLRNAARLRAPVSR